MRKKGKSAIVFLGSGRITSALAAGLRLAGFRPPIVVYDNHREKLRALRQESRAEIAPDLKSAVERGTILVIAVQPGSVQGLLREVAECGSPPGLFVSLAAGVPLRNLQDWLRAPARWARAMPSPVCRIGRGLTALCFDRGISRRDRRRVHELFAHVGQVVEVSEKKFDAFTATYSSSHGYHALATLANAAQRAGLDRPTALTAAAHALADGIEYWRKSGLGLEELLHEAATPGGIAAATMRGTDKAGYVRSVAKGLTAGIAQARKNAR